MAERKVVATQGLVSTFEITVKQTIGDTTKAIPAKFNYSKDPASLVEYLQGLPLDSETGPSVTGYWNLGIYAADLKARAAARESIAAESTIIKRDGKDIDLMDLPVEKAIKAVNAMFTLSAETGGEPQNAFVVTRRKLLEAGKALDKDGELVAK